MILVFLVLLVQEISTFSAENNAFSAKIVFLVLGLNANSASSANKDDEFD